MSYSRWTVDGVIDSDGRLVKMRELERAAKLRDRRGCRDDGSRRRPISVTKRPSKKTEVGSAVGVVVELDVNSERGW
jgi:hypothetical protein